MAGSPRQLGRARGRAVMVTMQLRPCRYRSGALDREDFKRIARSITKQALAMRPLPSQRVLQAMVDEELRRRDLGADGHCNT